MASVPSANGYLKSNSPEFLKMNEQQRMQTDSSSGITPCDDDEILCLQVKNVKGTPSADNHILKRPFSLIIIQPTTEGLIHITRLLEVNRTIVRCMNIKITFKALVS